MINSDDHSTPIAQRPLTSKPLSAQIANQSRASASATSASSTANDSRVLREKRAFNQLNIQNNNNNSNISIHEPNKPTHSNTSGENKPCTSKTATSAPEIPIALAIRLNPRPSIKRLVRPLIPRPPLPTKPAATVNDSTIILNETNNDNDLSSVSHSSKRPRYNTRRNAHVDSSHLEHDSSNDNMDSSGNSSIMSTRSLRPRRK